MTVNKYAAYCIVFVIFGVIMIVILAFVLPIIIPQFAQQVGEEVYEIIPGFDSIAFITSIICLFPIAMILIKRKIEKKSK